MIPSGITITGILFLLTIVSGIWVSKLGRPLHAVLFNIHKIIALVWIVFLILVINHLRKTVNIGNTELWLIISTGIFLLFNFASGALLSFDKLSKTVIQFIHELSAFLLVVSCTLTIYILANKV